jgi:hypothetical protein
LKEKEDILRQKENDLERHRIFTTFLESVVNDKSGNNEAFDSIEEL